MIKSNHGLYETKKGGNIKNTIGFSVKTGIKMFEAMIRDFWRLLLRCRTNEEMIIMRDNSLFDSFFKRTTNDIFQYHNLIYWHNYRTSSWRYRQILILRLSVSLFVRQLYFIIILTEHYRNLLYVIINHKKQGVLRKYLLYQFICFCRKEKYVFQIFPAQNHYWSSFKRILLKQNRTFIPHI